MVVVPVVVGIVVVLPLDDVDVDAEADIDVVVLVLLVLVVSDGSATSNIFTPASVTVAAAPPEEEVTRFFLHFLTFFAVETALAADPADSFLPLAPLPGETEDSLASPDNLLSPTTAFLECFLSTGKRRTGVWDWLPRRTWLAVEEEGAISARVSKRGVDSFILFLELMRVCC